MYCNTFGISYPGMVHFAFVDRSFDELTSPTILEESIVQYNTEFICIINYIVDVIICH